MATYAPSSPSIHERPKTRQRPRARERPALELSGGRAAPSDPLDFFRGLAIAIPIGLLLWIAIIRGASWLWWG